MTTQLLTPRQVAARLQFSVKHIYRLVSTGELRALKMSSRCLRFTEEDIQAFLDSRQEAR